MKNSLLLSINEHVNSQALLETNIKLNAAILFSDNNLSLSSLCEDAGRTLANIAIKLGSKAQLDDFEKTVDMVAGLKALGSSMNREALNIKTPLFKLVVQRAGQDNEIDSAISKVANHPSFATVRKEIADMLQRASESGDNEDNKTAVQMINKMRIGYEQLFNKLNAAEQTASK